MTGPAVDDAAEMAYHPQVGLLRVNTQPTAAG